MGEELTPLTLTNALANREQQSRNIERSTRKYSKTKAYSPCTLKEKRSPKLKKGDRLRRTVNNRNRKQGVKGNTSHKGVATYTPSLPQFTKRATHLNKRQRTQVQFAATSKEKWCKGNRVPLWLSEPIPSSRK